MRKKIILIAALVWIAAGAAYPSALSDAASSMQAGEWRELATQGLTSEFWWENVNGEQYYASNWHNWTNYLCWNPGTREMYWAGAPHLAPYAVIKYSDADNTWSHLHDVLDCMRLGGYSGCFNHGYDCGAIDAANGIFYFETYGTILCYKINTREWSQWTQSGLHLQRATALEFFPPLQKLVFVVEGIVQLIDPNTHVLKNVSSGLSMGTIANTAEYSPAHRKLYFGGGYEGGDSKAFYSMDSAERIVRLADAPEDFSCIRSSLTCDPVSGEPLLLPISNNFYAYDAAKNSWRSLPSPPIVLGSSDGSPHAPMTGPIAEYGVVFYLSGNKGKVYLYKHAAGTSKAEASGARAVTALSGLPNPVSRTTLMSLKTEMGPALRIHDLRGRPVADASRLPAGVYMMETVSGKHRSVKKIAVIK